MEQYGDWSIATIVYAYGGDEAEEINARTGCIGCPLAQEEKGLDTILLNPNCSHLAPLKGLKPLYRELRQESTAHGAKARLMALDRILTMQAECNSEAKRLGRPTIDLINEEEEARIRELIALKTWPEKWDGDEPTRDTVMETVYFNGAVQPLLFTD